MSLGPLEIGIIVLVVILLFGVGRISKVGGELGSGIRAFKQGLQGDEKENKEDKSTNPNDSDQSPS
jgi:sec-independent protein translocase protein TatA